MLYNVHKKEISMKNKNLVLIIFIIAITSFAGCTSQKETSVSSYEKITATEAKDMMDENSDIIILDVRTEEEFNSGHVEGALLIPDNEISDTAEDKLKDKSATILVYCRSGRRSALAANDLVKLGYSNVYDFGGIIDWKYDIVTE